MSYIFVLLLEKEKYYIGICKNPDKEIQLYFEGYGPKWIKKYKPKKVVEVIHPCDIFDVDKHTKRYMAKCGVNNVRGGAYRGIHLTKGDKNHIDKEIFTALGMCMHCGSELHISENCKYNTFSGQVKYFVLTMKQKFHALKSKIKDCIEDYKGDNYNKTYQTHVKDKEEKPLIMSFNNHYSESLTNSIDNNYVNRSEDHLITDSFSPSFSDDIPMKKIEPIMEESEVSDIFMTPKRTVTESTNILEKPFDELMNDISKSEPKYDDLLEINTPSPKRINVGKLEMDDDGSNMSLELSESEGI